MRYKKEKPLPRVALTQWSLDLSLMARSYSRIKGHRDNDKRLTCDRPAVYKVKSYETVTT